MVTIYTYNNVKLAFEVYSKPNDVKIYARCKTLRGRKVWHHYFKTLDSLNDKIAQTYLDFLESEKHKETWKNKDKEEAKELLNNLKLGDIFVCSWGYEQTNVDFYQVINIDKSKVTFKAIRGHVTRGIGFDYSGYVMPLKDNFTGEKSFEKVIRSRHVKLNSHSSMSLWDGKEHYYSSYY